MSTYSIIQKSQLEGANRLDAEYYQPEYLKIKKILKNQKLKSRPLGELVLRQVVTGSTPRVRECKGDGSDIKFIKTDTLRDGEIKFELADSLPVGQSRKLSEPQDGDVLVTIIGATYDIVGRSARVFVDDPEMNINQNIVLIRPKKLIFPGYLEAFLRSRFGRMQLWQQSRQTEQVNLNCREVENVLVPVINKKLQKQIDNLIEKARDFKLLAVNYYERAENLLLEKLGLKDFKPEDELWFIVNSSDVGAAHRADAEYFQPKYKRLIDKITSKSKISELGEIAVVKRGSLIDQEFYNEVEGMPYIRGRDFSSGCLEKSNLVYIDQHFKSSNETRVGTGDIVFASIGSVGTLALIEREFNNSIISNNTGKISIKNADKIIPEYLTIVLQSIIGEFQFEKEASRTAQPKISDSQVQSFKISILPRSTQQKIADLVKKSHQARKKSQELLEKAKRKVEEMIRKEGGNNGGKKT